MIPAGRAYTYGQMIVRNKGPKPITFLGATWSHRPADVEFLGARAAGDDRPITYGLWRGFPPAKLRRVSRPLEGYRLQPRKAGDLGLELLLGFRLRERGRYVLRGLTIRYRIGPDQYVKKLEDVLVVCTPPRYKEHCPL